MINEINSECPHCKFLDETFLSSGEKNNREYWLMTEVFVYLHGSDICNYKHKYTFQERLQQVKDKQK